MAQITDLFYDNIALYYMHEGRTGYQQIEGTEINELNK